MSDAVGIVSDPRSFAAARVATTAPAAAAPAVMRAALLVDPTGFRVSEESATDNRYMHVGVQIDPERAHAQHAALRRKLAELGVPVLLFPGREGLDDGIYPNNVFGTVPDRFIVGAMLHRGRRKEAEREDVRELFTESFGYRLVDLSGRGFVAELTGPLVIDRARRIGYCGRSQRVDDRGCAAMHGAFDLRLTFCFDLAEGEYHTNLVLAVLAGRGCVLDPRAFADPAVADSIASVYEDRVLSLSPLEKAAFAGNCIAVTPHDVLFSQTALAALRPEALRSLESWGFRAHGVEVDELEKGGGSLRCLIAEVF